MKRILVVCILSVVMFSVVSCTKQLKNADLINKGIIKARVVIRDDSESELRYASRLYFRKLVDGSNILEGKMISSEVHDGDSIAINVDPGTYILFGGMRGYADTLILTFFDEEIIQKFKVELKAGDTVDLGDIYVLETKGNFLGSVTPVQKKNRDDLIKAYESLAYVTKLGSLEQWRYKKKKDNKDVTDNKAEEKKKADIEEFQ